MTQYTVQPGDSISKIALKYYGTYNPIGPWDPIKAIAAASGVANANLISVGQVLNIPDKPTAAVVPTSTSVAVPNSGTGTTVAPVASGSQSGGAATPQAPTSKNTRMAWMIAGSVLLAGGAALALKKYRAKKNGKKKATA